MRWLLLAVIVARGSPCTLGVDTEAACARADAALKAAGERGCGPFPGTHGSGVQVNAGETVCTAQFGRKAL